MVRTVSAVRSCVNPDLRLQQISPSQPLLVGFGPHHQHFLAPHHQPRNAVTEPILIKKYANRRLYDTRQSRYITLDELAQIVRGGTDVSVVDAKSGGDLTRQVLIQVLLEEQDRLDMLPPELLHHVIRVQGTIQAAPFQRWLADSFRQWNQLGAVLQQGLAANPAAAAMMKAMQGWTGGAPAGAGGRAEPTPSAEAEPEAEADAAPEAEPTPKAEPAPDPMAALRAQMDDLLGRLKG